LVAIEGIARDVTERKRVEEALRTTQEFLGGILDNAPLPIYGVSEEGRQFRENNRRVIETETPLIEEEWAESPDGRHYFQTIKVPLRDPDRRTVAIGGISLDVTERVGLRRRSRRRVGPSVAG
jgi:PAS domain-containing protein